jgi:hypothetical protein
MRDGAGEIVIFQKRQTQEYRRAEVNGGVDAFHVHVFKALHRIPHAGRCARFARNRRSADATAHAAGFRPDLAFEQ